MGVLKSILTLLPLAFEVIGKGIDAFREWRARKTVEATRAEKHQKIDAAIDGEKKP